ncbi:inositol monophosphatase family protein [Pseudoprimorskyibacter insulae]|uniref:Fructose-1, 6-bisphosphatase/inositol-1-monophosphatase n=1 Tax=Pseudoprimorskyibacter insulae TaxID=1695997 RepID=A0A2R8AUS1_9RHOB|nr:3'(2'),5'-bisphosphate nucleotidase CysQ [Pseudoprimorskyibacter insulae]SPF79798.1 Fructose-1, 6-bisphosphatase/inositol-1-monophosphatase [Pseudoprimorskyibacter insulae]
MPASDLDLLIGVAREAGDVARSFVGGPLDIRHKDDDAGPVTAADYAVNRLLEDRLRSARPDYGWLSEESPDSTDRLGSEYVFIVDPIDGTRSFIDGQDTWAHSLAIVRDGKPVAAAVFLPLLDRLYTAELGGGAALNGDAIRASGTTDLNAARVLAARPTLDEHHWSGAVPPLQRSHRPSLAYRMSLVAQGRFDMMLTFRPSWEWDIAAGALILQEAGAIATDKAGRPLRFNNRHPQTNGVVAGNAALHRAVLDRLA